MPAFRRKRGAAKTKTHAHTNIHNTGKTKKNNDSNVRSVRSLSGLLFAMSGSNFYPRVLVLVLSGLLHDNGAQPRPSSALNRNILVVVHFVQERQRGFTRGRTHWSCCGTAALPHAGYVRRRVNRRVTERRRHFAAPAGGITLLLLLLLAGVMVEGFGLQRT